MADFDTALNSILGNSEAMGQIMSLAQSLSGTLGGGTQEQEQTGEAACGEEHPAGAAEHGGNVLCGGSASRDAALLQALRPYLRRERQEQVDRALEMVGMLRLLRGTFGAAHGSE